jgi:hypothetical protein
LGRAKRGSQRNLRAVGKWDGCHIGLSELNTALAAEHKPYPALSAFGHCLF